MPPFIPIRLPRAQHYSHRLVEFLADIGASLGDLDDARNRVMAFMQTNDAQRMPRHLRRQIIREGLYDPERVHEWIAQGLGISIAELDRLFALAHAPPGSNRETSD